MFQLFYSATETIDALVSQTATTSPSLFWTIVASAFGGALISGVIALLVKFIDRRHEQKIWLRNTQHKTYIEVATFLKDYSWKLRDDPKYASEEVHKKLLMISIELPMICSNKVGVRYTNFVNMLNTYLDSRKNGHPWDDVRFNLLQNSMHALTEQMGQDVHKRKKNKGKRKRRSR